MYPIAEAVAEEFQRAHQGQVTVGVSGTGGGFQKFCNGETDISDASRPIRPAEIEACQKAGVEYIELPVAYDGLAIVVNPKNTWASTITVDELKRLWSPEAQGTITRWNQVRPSWPDREIRLFGAGVDSGTYDYFTEAIVGEEGASRGDFTSSEDDNVLVQGIANDELALGFLPLAYVEQNTSRLKMVPVDDGKDGQRERPDHGVRADRARWYLPAALSPALRLRLPHVRGSSRGRATCRVVLHLGPAHSRGGLRPAHAPDLRTGHETLR